MYSIAIVQRLLEYSLVVVYKYCSTCTITLFWVSDGQLQSYYSLPDCNSEIVCCVKTSISADTHVLYHWQNDPYERIMYIANYIAITI